MKKKELTHVDARGHARMVDVSDKEISHRAARARATIRMKRTTRALLFSGKVKKGDALAIAKVAGISAAKRTPDLIPLCHGISLTRVGVEIEKGKKEGEVVVHATAEARDRTGVEMEALTAASVAALTIYDMVKSVDRGVSFEIVLDEKRGGKSGTWRR